MSRTHNEHSTSRGAGLRNKPTRTLSKLERDIRAYELTLQGCSVRGVCEELGIKSTDTAHNAIQRGKAHVIEKGIDVEERRIEIDKLFKDTLGMLAQTIRHQVEHGQEEFYVDENGRKSMKRRVGVDPRIAGELSRSLNRWAEFCGLLDRAPEVTNQATTLVQLTAPGDGAAFADRWSGAGAGETVDVSSSSEHESGHNLSTQQTELSLDAGSQGMSNGLVSRGEA